ncbi:MAG: hypothetical protein IMX05_02375 [Hydrogenibacillus schlegelii]|nr:hypothetical protein [Hydrogenibacillus schlegelii]
MLYDALYPPEIVWAGFSTMKNEAVRLSDGLRQLELRPLGSGRFEVVRYTSPVALEYLNPYLRPGTVLRLSAALDGAWAP